MADRGNVTMLRSVVEAGGVRASPRALSTRGAIAQAKLDRRRMQVIRDRNTGPGFAIESLADASTGCNMA
jgi:hypothetical protein